MTLRCQICGEFESEEVTVIPGHDVCYDCVDTLVENEIERRGLHDDARMLSQGQGGDALLAHIQDLARQVK